MASPVSAPWESLRSLLRKHPRWNRAIGSSVVSRRDSSNESSILKAVDARSSERSAYLKNTLDRRRQAEETDVAQVLDELATMIRKELEESEKQTYDSGLASNGSSEKGTYNRCECVSTHSCRTRAGTRRHSPPVL